ILEPSNTFKVIVEYRGAASAVIECSAGGGHTSTPWLGDSACTKLCGIDSKLRALCSDASSCRNSPVASVVSLRCGGEWNVIPRHGVAGINVRVPAGYTYEDVLDFVKGLAPSDCSVALRSFTPPVKVSPSNPVPRALMRGLLRLGFKPTLARKFGTSDMNLLYGKVTHDTAAYGPGRSELSHTDREVISVEELGVGAAVYGLAVLQLSEWWVANH
ncbi:MAG: peptidase dimerization domain-containing protein, partial [Desulfurococcales archaeon]|nr:peptidase dimerization domain-containing protein [Desulfurococcales archaeon]